MRRIALVFALAAGGIVCTSPASAQQRIDINGGFEAVEVGTYQADVTTAWTDIDGSDFAALGTTTLTATRRMVQIVIINSHATQDLFVLFRVGAPTATANSFKLEAGQSHTWTGLLSLNSGAGVTTMALQGSAINTTAQVEVWFR